MRTNDSKTSVDSKLEEMEEKYPVEQIAVKNEKKITIQSTIRKRNTKRFVIYAEDRKARRVK